VYQTSNTHDLTSELHQINKEFHHDQALNQNANVSAGGSGSGVPNPLDG